MVERLLILLSVNISLHNVGWRLVDSDLMIGSFTAGAERLSCFPSRWIVNRVFGSFSQFRFRLWAAARVCLQLVLFKVLARLETEQGDLWTVCKRGDNYVYFFFFSSSFISMNFLILIYTFNIMQCFILLYFFLLGLRLKAVLKSVRKFLRLSLVKSDLFFRISEVTLGWCLIQASFSGGYFSPGFLFGFFKFYFH